MKDRLDPEAVHALSIAHVDTWCALPLKPSQMPNVSSYWRSTAYGELVTCSVCLSLEDAGVPDRSYYHRFLDQADDEVRAHFAEAALLGYMNCNELDTMRRWRANRAVDGSW